ncbi:MAG: hypothetical protein V4469_02245 [Patescibacteria group bacterium]
MKLDSGSVHVNSIMIKACLYFGLIFIGELVLAELLERFYSPDNGAPIAGFLSCIVFVFFMYWLMKTFSDAQKGFMQTVAKKFGFDYIYEKGQENVLGGNLSLFSYGDFRFFSNVVLGTYDGLSFKIFNYSYSDGIKVGSQKVEKMLYSEDGRHVFTVFESIHKSSVSQIMINPSYSLLKAAIDGKKTPFVQKQEVPKPAGLKELKLEGNFNDYFRVLCKDGHEAEVYELLTPDVMEFLIKNAKDVGLEFNTDRMYMYTDHLISQIGEMNKNVELFVRLNNFIGQQLENIK